MARAASAPPKLTAASHQETQMQFALFGAGRIGWVHAQNIANHPDAKLSHVYDVDGSAARRLVAALGGKVAETPEEIWTADAVNAVLVASSTNTHIDLMREAMRAGKAIYCEKPIDIDLAKARTFAVEARDAVAPIFVGFRRRFLPELQAIRQRILGGDIGPVEVVLMMARDFQPPPLAYVKVSGGFVRDKAIHYLDLLCWMTGEAPVEAHATGACLVDPEIGQVGDVDTVMITLKMPSGALCQITNGRRSAFGGHERIEVYGALGLLQWDPDQAGRDRACGGRGRYFERHGAGDRVSQAGDLRGGAGCVHSRRQVRRAGGPIPGGRLAGSNHRRRGDRIAGDKPAGRDRLCVAGPLGPTRLFGPRRRRRFSVISGAAEEESMTVAGERSDAALAAVTYDHDDNSVLVIIGSGAAGGTLADELTQKGIDVVILEAGRRFDPDEIENDEVAMDAKLSWNDRRVCTGSSIIARTFPEKPTSMCKAVGGSTIHWGGTCLRLREHEFRTATVYGVIPGAEIADWPFGLAELEPTTKGPRTRWV